MVPCKPSRVRKKLRGKSVKPAGKLSVWSPARICSARGSLRSILALAFALYPRAKETVVLVLSTEMII